jgi:hypothetical protein
VGNLLLSIITILLIKVIQNHIDKSLIPFYITIESFPLTLRLEMAILVVASRESGTADNHSVA